MIPPNWNQDQRYESDASQVLLHHRPAQPGKGGKGVPRVGPVNPMDPFPSLPSSGRMTFPQYVPEGVPLDYSPPFQPPPPPPAAQIPLSQALRQSLAPAPPPAEYQRGSVWSSPPHGPSVWQPPVTDPSVPLTFLAPEDSPRTFHERMKTFTGIGAEAYRSSFGLPEDRGIAWELHCMRERTLARDPSLRVPEVVQHKYHSLLQLDTNPGTSDVLGHRTCAYKALSTTDPFVYCLRRVDGFRLSNFDLVQEAIEKWSEIKHPNVVAVRQAFATSEFQDFEGHGEGGSLVYVYDYIDLAQTLEAWHDSNETKPVHSTVLWDVIVQAALALRLIHSRNLAARCVHPSKILVSSRFRIHLNCLGLVDAIQHHALGAHSDASTKPTIAGFQRNDLASLARVVLMLGLGKRWFDVQTADISDLLTEARKSLPESIVKVTEALVSPSAAAEAIVAMSGSFIAFKAEQLETTQDVLVAELRKFVDLSRLNKILVKICAVADRANLLDDWRWSSTGDRYVVQLFKDYVFGQNDEMGRPFFDVGHVTDCLAKVDIGSFEPVMLMNRDGSSVIVTNYNDIRRCVEASFKEISDASLPRHIR